MLQRRDDVFLVVGISVTRKFDELGRKQTFKIASRLTNSWLKESFLKRLDFVGERVLIHGSCPNEMLGS